MIGVSWPLNKKVSQAIYGLSRQSKKSGPKANTHSKAFRGLPVARTLQTANFLYLHVKLATSR